MCRDKQLKENSTQNPLAQIKKIDSAPCILD